MGIRIGDYLRKNHILSKVKEMENRAEQEKVKEAYDILGEGFEIVKYVDGKEHTMFRDGSGSVERVER